jgi:hypothetical protein
MVDSPQLGQGNISADVDIAQVSDPRVQAGLGKLIDHILESQDRSGQ